MKEEGYILLLEKLRELAKKEGISLEALMEKIELGELGLKFWEEVGKEKIAEEVLRVDLAELVKEIQRLRENLP